MNLSLLSLILAAVTSSGATPAEHSAAAELPTVPAVVLEPTPPAGFHRLEARSVTASSSLRDPSGAVGRNYLPLHVADEDPATAWVEGAPGRGVGEWIDWVGPQLAHARAYCVFVRNGYQKSMKLHAENGRPKRLRLQALVPWADDPPDAASGVEVELADVVGWQRLDVPIDQYAMGLRLTLLDVYLGSKHEDTGISDIRIYVDGDDPYDAAREAAAAEATRTLLAQIAAAASARPEKNRAPLDVLPRYEIAGERRQVEVPKPSTSDGDMLTGVLTRAAATAGDAGKERLARAVQAVAELEALHGRNVVDGPPAGWRRVSVTPLVVSSALSRVNSDEGFYAAFDPVVPSLLSRHDAALVPDSGEKQSNASRILAALRAAVGTEQCATSCRALMPKVDVDLESWGSLAERCEYECSPDARDGGPAFGDVERVARTQVLVDATGGAYRRLYRAEYSDIGERETYWMLRETFVAYRGDEAECIVSRVDDGTSSVVVLEWESAKARGAAPRLAGFTVYTAYKSGDGQNDSAWVTSFEGKAS